MEFSIKRRRVPSAFLCVRLRVLSLQWNTFDHGGGEQVNIYPSCPEEALSIRFFAACQNGCIATANVNFNVNVQKYYYFYYYYYYHSKQTKR